MVMAHSGHHGGGIVHMIVSIIQNPIFIQVVLFAVLIPILLDWLKKQKALKGVIPDASTNTSNDKR
jgi:hypothetical protein